MNSVQHVVLGIVLVGIAFMFGSYLTSQQTPTQNLANLNPVQPAAKMNPVASMPIMRSSATESRDHLSTDSETLVEANLVPRSLPKNATLQDNSLERIEAPDFSKFSIFSLDEPAETLEQVDAGPVLNEIAKPNFVQLNPALPKRVMGSINKPKPLRHEPKSESLLALRRPNLIRPNLIQDEDLAVEIEYMNPPAPSVRDAVIHGKFQALPAKTNLASIQPRTAAPVMLNATRFERYRSVSGDTLQELAVRFYGDPNYYLDIYVANQHQLKNPTVLPANTELRIPVYQ